MNAKAKDKIFDGPSDCLTIGCDIVATWSLILLQQNSQDPQKTAEAEASL